jgi:hypothetical protein
MSVPIDSVSRGSREPLAPACCAGLVPSSYRLGPKNAMNASVSVFCDLEKP